MENIDLDLIKPLHEVRSQRLLSDLTKDMKDNGWQGRPLLVIAREHDFLAWTGSHRIAAAIEAGLESIPCHVIEERRLTKLGFDADFGHVDDGDRLAILRKMRDEEACQIMWAEGRD